MSNLNLNAGGVVGALLCGAIAGVVIFSATDSDGRGPYKFVILAVIGGAFAGNFLWGRIFTGDE